MKKVCLFGISLLLILNVFAQVPPKGINYQAVARNYFGEVIWNAPITVRMTVINNSPSGTIEYCETTDVSTNQFGLFNIVIGRGTPVYQTFDSIHWGSGSKWLRVEIDITPHSGNYILMPPSELMSVPYALYAASGTPGPTGPAGVAGPTGPAGGLNSFGSTSNDNDPSVGQCSPPNNTVDFGPTALTDFGNTGIDFNIAGLNGNVCRVVLTIDSLVHPNDADLTFTLTSPTGTSRVLSTNNGGAGDDYLHTVFDDGAATAITAGTPPFSGTFAPQQALAAFIGENPTGIWTLNCFDATATNVGTFFQGTLTITTDIVTYTYLTEVTVPVALGETTIMNGEYSTRSSLSNSNFYVMISRDVVSGAGSVGTAIAYSASTARAVNNFVSVNIGERDSGMTPGTYIYKLWAVGTPQAGTENYSLIVTKH